MTDWKHGRKKVGLENGYFSYQVGTDTVFAGDPAAFWATLQEHAPDVAKALAEAAPAPGHRTALADTGDHDYVCDICCQSGAEEHTLRACAVLAQEQLDRLRDKLADAAPRAAPPGWQPIETAPTNGAAVLLHWTHWQPDPVIGRFRHGAWESDAALSSGPGPTHWMSLPSTDAAPRAGVTAVYPHRVRPTCGNLRTANDDFDDFDDFELVFTDTDDCTVNQWDESICAQLDEIKEYHMHITFVEADE